MIYTKLTSYITIYHTILKKLLCDLLAEDTREPGVLCLIGDALVVGAEAEIGDTIVGPIVGATTVLGASTSMHSRLHWLIGTILLTPCEEK